MVDKKALYTEAFALLNRALFLLNEMRKKHEEQVRQEKMNMSHGIK